MIYLVIGRRELGKTTLARYLGHAKHPRLIVDPRNQWPVTTDEGPADSVNPDHVLEDLESGQDVLIQPEDLDDAIRSLAWPARRFITESPDRELTVIFDEAGLYRDTLKTSWSYMMRGSPRMRTAIILTAHRPSDIATDIRALVQTLKPYEFVSWNDSKAEHEVHKNPAAWYQPAATPLKGEPVRRGLF